jgi:AAA domain/PLD-like domain
MPKDIPASTRDDASKLLSYWRASVSDSMFGKGRFRMTELRRNARLSSHAMEAGRLPPRQTQAIFEGRDEGEGSVPIRLWPRVYARTVNHGTARQDGLPDALAPIVSEAVLTRGGYILPGRTLIPRDLLEPLTTGALSIGTVEAQDKFLSDGGFGEEHSISTHAVGWTGYLKFCDQLLEVVSGDWFDTDASFTERSPGFFEVADDASAMVRGILSLYDDLIARDDVPSLMRNYARIAPRSLSPLLPKPYALSERLGHSNDIFPTAENQRDVLAHLAKAEHGEIIAVNGPPGTGKTTMLLSAIASAWVKAAAEEGDPPVIVAASANNQAVTNIIDAFGKDYAVGTGPFAGRWLPDIKSFGLFLSSAAREQEASKTYQTESFVRTLETQAYVTKAKAAYLSKAQVAFEEPDLEDVEEVTKCLRDRINAQIAKMTNIDKAHAGKLRSETALTAELGNDPGAALGERQTRLTEVQGSLTEVEELAQRWDRHVANESALLAFFSFLPSVARKRLAAARTVFREAGFGDLADQLSHVSAAGSDILNKKSDTRSAAETATKSVKRATSLIAKAEAAGERYQSAVTKLSQDLADSEIYDVDSFADFHIRFPLFLLATHYWEGRWLLEMEKVLPDIDKEQKRSGKKAVIPRWYRRMMLTPCAVATFATLPGKMTCRAKRGNAFVDDYLYDFIDLLIIDEAGQVLPEIAAPSLALAKQALVVGDTRQIEPISSIPKAIDLGNLEKSDVIPENMDETELAEVLSSGFLSHSGSVMACAQNACRYQPYPDLDRGLYLFEHRRCFDEIIEFSNALCYRGHLQLKRGPAKGIDLPPMGYFHIDGAAYFAGGSRFNPAEAQTIAAWLVAHRESLESQYQQKLEDILAIVTPFGKQAQELRQACGAVGIRVIGAGAMTIGTVHSLQGAERPIVLFSPAYAKGLDGSFIDSSTSMLNVAVSRAKDNFLVFGDMDLFSMAPHGSPREVLSTFLFARPENALEFDVQPREDLKKRAAEVKMLRNADDHDIFLRDILASAQKTVEIVSPWTIKSTMEKNGFLSLMRDAAARGVRIDVYADPALNKKINDDGLSQYDEAGAALSAIGVTLHPVSQLHSKIVTADEDVFCIGSFNWLSADRVGRYARHETSLVYSGADMANEIERFRENLGLRCPH